MLKYLASECKFSENMRNEHLRDRLVSGVRDDRMLYDLLKKKLNDLTFDKAVTKCLAHEQANKDVHALKGDAGQTSVRVQVLQSDKQQRRRRGPKTNTIKQQPAGNELNTKPQHGKCTCCGELHDSKTC